MNSSETRRSVSSCEPTCRTSGGPLDGCGVCPTCVSAPESAAATRRLWGTSDDFQRTFIVDLILRCRDTRVLRGIQTALSVTSWTLFTYTKSKGPTCRRKADPESDGKPPGVNVTEIRDWFDGSPDWIKSRYLYRLLLICDPELLRMVANLTNVLLVRQKRGFLQSEVSSYRPIQHDQSDEDSEEPALTVVPGSSKSLSGVSRYRDFIGGLPVNLSKRILGMLDEATLRRCQTVCQRWQHLAQETMEETKFRKKFQDQIKALISTFRGVNKVSPYHASFIGVPVPVKGDEEVDLHPGVPKVEPFAAAYAKVKTKTVQMEERNVYCGAYFTTVLLNREDPHRVVDYRGGSLLATGSKDCKVRLLHVASDTREISAMKGHVGSVRAVLLCQDRGLVITGSCDKSIRCWDLRTDVCVMVLYGHSGNVNCLDVHADRLVSGGKDFLVKVWSLHTGTELEDLKFSHPSPVRCVRIGARTVYSSCDQGLVKIWDMEDASLLRVIDAHRSSVKCLFFDDWHLLSGDSGGQVMAWSVNCDAKQCLMTFSHPKEVKSLTLLYLRVITGCADGKIRIFNFLTGDCLRDITVGDETGQIQSLHVHDNGILVNAKSSVKRYQFSKVFWDYAASTEGGRVDAPDKSAASLGRPHLTAVGVNAKAQVASPGQKAHDCSGKKPERAELLRHSHFLSSSAKGQAEAGEPSAKQSVIQSERATSERIKRRGPHNPLTRDSILLKVSAMQRAQRTDEASINTERNALLRDSWGPRAPQDPPQPDPQAPKQSQRAHTQPQPNTREARPGKGKTCVPALKGAVNQSATSTIQDGAVSPGADAHRAISATEGPQAPHRRLVGFPPNPEYSKKSTAGLPSISPVDPFRDQVGFRLLTLTQMEESEMLRQKLSKKKDNEEKGARKKSHV